MSASLPQKSRVNLPEALADPQRYSVAEAIAEASAVAQDHPIDDELADLLQEELDKYGGRAAHLGQLLAIVTALHCEQLVLPFRSRLLGHPDRQVKLGAALIVGRANRSADWIARQLLDPDTLLQANAVESAWGVDTKEMRAVLAMAARSRNNRVAANALVGLYLVGDISSIPRLLEMAEHAEEGFRRSARWAMGETADARFLPYLSAAFRTDELKCRTMTIRSLGRIRRRMSSWQDSGGLGVRISTAGIASDQRRRLRVSVLPRGTEEPPVLTPLNFIIYDNSALVTEYTVEPTPNAEVLIVGFIAPRITSMDDPYGMAIEQALEGCVAMKRDCDRWWISRYHSVGAPAASEPAESAVLPEDPVIANHVRWNHGLLAGRGVIRKMIEGPGRKEDALASLRASVEVTTERLSRVSGCRHIFIFADPQGGDLYQDVEALFHGPGTGRPAVHLVSPRPGEGDRGLIERCYESGGELIAMPAEALAEEVRRAYAALLNRYELSWRGSGCGPGVLQVRILHPRGCAEVSAPTS